MLQINGIKLANRKITPRTPLTVKRQSERVSERESERASDRTAGGNLMKRPQDAAAAAAAAWWWCQGTVWYLEEGGRGGWLQLLTANQRCEKTKQITSVQRWLRRLGKKRKEKACA